MKTFIVSHKVALLLVGVALAGFLLYRSRASQASAGNEGGVPVNPYSSTPPSGGFSVQGDQAVPGGGPAYSSPGYGYGYGSFPDTSSGGGDTAGSAGPDALTTATAAPPYITDPASRQAIYDAFMTPSAPLYLNDPAVAAIVNQPAPTPYIEQGITQYLAPLMSTGTAPTVSAPISDERPLSGRTVLA